MPVSPGRPKGVPNKTTTLIKDAILLAATNAGGVGGLVGYLETQAIANPTGFMTLLGKVIPTQITNGDDDAFKVVTTIERRIVRPPN